MGNEVEIAPDSPCEYFSPECDPGKFWLFAGIVVCLVVMAGLMSGLTMGMLSLDNLNIKILQMEGTDQEKKYAKQVLPVIQKHHYLLVTLLIMNAAANEAMPIFLNKLVPEVTSIILSVTCVLFFGEIIPSALFTGKHQLRIAAWLTPFVQLLMLICGPLAYPISKLLDCLIGEEIDINRYKRKELKALITLQKEERENLAAKHEMAMGKSPSRRRKSEDDLSNSDKSSSEHELLDSPGKQAQYSAQGTALHIDEVTVIHGALDLAAKSVDKIMVNFDSIFMLEASQQLNHNVMADILASGHSRIPVYRGRRNNIIGLLLVKRLIVLDPADSKPIEQLCLRKPIVIKPNESCYSMLNEFQKGQSHIALVTNDIETVTFAWDEGYDIPEDVEFLGIITIEDVIEELIQEEIEDESDMYVHDIVNFWKSKGRRQKLREMGTTFANRKLKILAEKARRRVRSRKLREALANTANDAKIQAIAATSKSRTNSWSKIESSNSSEHSHSNKPLRNTRSSRRHAPSSNSNVVLDIRDEQQPLLEDSGKKQSYGGYK